MNQVKTRIRAIAFDLDDTLLDTTNLLAPMASRQAYETLKTYFADLNFEIFESRRKQLAASLSHPEIFNRIATDATQERRSREGQPVTPPELLESLIKKATVAFYSPKVPKQLPLLPGALENLRYLHTKYILFLVTSGIPEIQAKKISACEISPFFKRSYLMSSLQGETKRAAFEDILAEHKLKADELLSCGNRLSLEIRDAKLCGAQTCFFKYGEHSEEKPIQPEDFPDFTIYTHGELIKTCQL